MYVAEDVPPLLLLYRLTGLSPSLWRVLRGSAPEEAIARFVCITTAGLVLCIHSIGGAVARLRLTVDTPVALLAQQ